jgi:hypothetical protein
VRSAHHSGEHDGGSAKPVAGLVAIATSTTPSHRLNATANRVVREIDLDELCRDMRSPTDDEVPTALDGTRLDTKEKLVAYLNEMNDRRERARVG